MGDGYTVQRLIAKRATIAGKIEHLQDEIRQLVADLNHLDATIHVFDPSIELHEIRNRTVPPRHHAFRGEVTRIVLAALKEGHPLTTQQVAHRVMVERGLDPTDKRLAQLMFRRAGACLKLWRQRGIVARSPGPGRLMLWDLCRSSCP